MTKRSFKHHIEWKKPVYKHTHTEPYCFQAQEYLKPIYGIGFNSMWNVNLQMFKLHLEKAEEPQIKLPTTVGSSKKQESARETSTSAL